jgi:uncharacterized protein
MIKREMYLQKIRPFINSDLIKILTGIRRSGKSVMLELIKEEIFALGVGKDRFVSVNFEDADNQSLCTADALHTYISKEIKSIEGKVYIFFDEIQEVESWEKCVNSLRVKFDVDIYITGSNAKLLSGEFATYLAGRYVEFVVYPLSFSEFTDMYKSLNPESSVAETFNQYLLFGGMPFLINLEYQAAPCQQYLKDLYNSVVLKDIMKRNNIRYVDLLERVITYVLANIGKTFSATSISKYFKSEDRKVSPETILNYLKACEDAFLFYRVKRQDLVGKKILEINEKYYVADHGLRESIYGKNNRDIEIILENIVYIELLRKGYTVTIGKINNLEIDFVAENAGGRIYVQVAYLLAAQSTIEREFGSLKAIDDNFAKYVVTMDEIDMGRDGMRHINIRDFLLMNKY